jgi:hypothetical protein
METPMRMLNLFALSMLTLSVGLAADHPITISNDSPLTLGHDSWKPINDQQVSSSVTDTVRRVAVSSDTTGPWLLNFNGEAFTLDLDYGSTHLTVTANNGKAAVVTVDPNTSFQKHFDFKNNQYISKNPNATITNVTVKKAGVDQHAPPAFLGANKITVCYGKPTSKSLPECK